MRMSIECQFRGRETSRDCLKSVHFCNCLQILLNWTHFRQIYHLLSVRFFMSWNDVDINLMTKKGFIIIFRCWSVDFQYWHMILFIRFWRRWRLHWNNPYSDSLEQPTACYSFHIFFFYDTSSIFQKAVAEHGGKP